MKSAQTYTHFCRFRIDVEQTMLRTHTLCLNPFLSTGVFIHRVVPITTFSSQQRYCRRRRRGRGRGRRRRSVSGIKAAQKFPTHRCVI